MWKLYAILFLGILYSTAVTPQQGNKSAPSPRQRDNSVLDLAFKDFFDFSTGEPKPSSKLLAMNNKHVRLVGFMAQMEKGPEGGFYLSEHPVSCDEGGGGTADLPLENVLVIAPSFKGRPVSFIPVRLEVTGILEVGRREEQDGRVSYVRLLLDRPGALPPITPKARVRNPTRQ